MVTEAAIEARSVFAASVPFCLSSGSSFFVFNEGSGFFFRGFNIVEFFTSIEWYPTSQSHVRYGVLALIAGTAA